MYISVHTSHRSNLQYLTDTSVRYPQCSRDHARADSPGGQLHYLGSERSRQGSPVNEYAP